MASETVRDSMRHERVQARMWNRVYIKRVLVEDLMGGQKEQHSEHGAGPQQQHICRKEGGKVHVLKDMSDFLFLIELALAPWLAETNLVHYNKHEIIQSQSL